MKFWDALDLLLSEHLLHIDRPKGSAHPRYPEVIYPLDYGYLVNTLSGDQSGIDVWVGSQAEKKINGVVVTVDLLKRDSEIKILVGCSEDEMAEVVRFHSGGRQAAHLVRREG